MATMTVTWHTAADNRVYPIYRPLVTCI